MKKGKLIVIDGADGSGKETQTKLLMQRLKKAGLKVRTLDFPRYEDNFFGSFIHACQNGKYGDFLKIDPYVGSVLYAADRFESAEKVKAWIAAGDTVVLDRYVSANQIHQGGKIVSAAKRKRFIAWLEKMEYGVFKIPRPDLTIYLDVPPKMTKILLKNSGKKLDLTEKDDAYRQNSYKSAQWLMKNTKGWERVICAPDGVLRSIEDIHSDLITIFVKKRIISRSMVK